MTLCVVYIGDLNTPSFDWDRGDGIPRNLHRDFPPDGSPYLGSFHEWVKKTGVECKLTWYEVWVAKVTKSQIQDYISYCYASDPSYMEPNEDDASAINRLNLIKKFVTGLNSKDQYALVAMEVY